MTTALLSLPIFRAFDSAGLPLAGGLLYSYAANTLTPQNTYSDALGTSPNTNPVTLDSTGSATIRLDPSLSYKLVLKASNGTTQWTEDNVQGAYIFGSVSVDTFTATAGQTAFTLTSTPGSINSLTVSIDGAVLTGGVDFTLSGTTLTLLSGALVGQLVRVAYSTGIATSALSDGSVFDSTLAAGSVVYSIEKTYERTAAEISASVTPTNYGYAPGDVRRYGNSLSVAVTAGGTGTFMVVVPVPITVAADLTVPSNVDLRVEGNGLITVSSGKRLYINGSFSAPKRSQCFSASILSTTVTASVSGLTLIVTAVSASVLASGQIVTGGGLPDGVVIEQTAGGGTGTYTLNGAWGAIASTTFTVTGASVIFGPGSVDCTYPDWFGAIGDSGTTDNTSAIRHAVYSQQWGGRVHINAGNYKVTDCTVLHGGITIEGDGITDTSTGSPTTSEISVPTHVYQATDSKAIWVIPCRSDHVTVKRMSHGAAASISGANPIGTGRRGIMFNGHAPQFVYAPEISHCYFYNLERGVDINDGLASGATNWGVNPGLINNCQFIYCTYGVIIYTDNADAWKLDQCVFILAANTSGVYLIRCGFIKLDTCFAFGNSLANTQFVNVQSIETGNPIDTICFDNCQSEFCAHFLVVQGSHTRNFDIVFRNCIPQLGSDIYLGKICTLTSYNTHLMAFVYYDAANVRINSYADWFEYQNFSTNPTWNYVNAGSGDAAAITTYLPGPFPSSTLGTNAIINGWSLTKAPTVQTGATYTVGAYDISVVANRAGTVTLTLPSASSSTGRKIRCVTQQNQTVVSASANVVPIVGGAAGTAILAATAGKWADIESDGTNWNITASN